MDTQPTEEPQVLPLPKLPTERGRKNARSPGHSPRLPFGGNPQLLTNDKFMSASQKRAHREGVAIYV